ncbi:MAG: TraB/GumN family protein [Chromatiaceae bacterium]|jgi:hypothetical protein
MSAKPWVVALLVVMLLDAVGHAEVTQVTRIPVFELRRDGDTAGYLVGTMHSDDPRVMANLVRIMPLIERVDRLAIEIVPDGLAMLAIGAATLLPAGERLSDRVGPARSAALSEAARVRGLPPDAIDRLKPWAAAITLGMPALTGDQVLDTAVYLAALERGLGVVGLETASEQIRVFDDMSDALQLQLLDATINNAEVLPMQLEALTAAYLSGDVAQIEQVVRTQYDEVSLALQNWVKKTLVDRRNATMLDRALPLFDDARVLIAVGAMHLGGARGLIEGLRQSGFEVTPLRGQGPTGAPEAPE